MADLSPPHPPPPPPQQPSSTNFAIDSDDISSLLHTLLQSSSQQQPQQQPPPRQFSGSSGFVDSPGLLDPNFPYSASYYGSTGLSADGVDDGDCHSEDETRGKSASGRTSSKRSRAAEVHNMSEKRRRQRINEKMKALQKLIPNSNKTDKASMLDEAIEYLKQLQLQVQMLTMRNGSSSHPFYLPPAVQPPGPLDEANSSRVGSFTADQEASMQAMLNLSNKPVSSDYKLLMARMSENSNSGQACVPESSITLQYRPYNASMASKVLCKDPALPQLQLDMSQYGQSSSSGVSS